MDIIHDQGDIMKSEKRERFTCETCEKIFFSCKRIMSNKIRKICPKCELNFHI